MKSNDEYRLVSMEKAYPQCVKDKRKDTIPNFEQLKKDYDYQCATCGNKENEPARYTKCIVILHKGHMDPRKALKLENCIPQCQICNQHYKNKYVFDKQGRIIKNL